MKNNLAENIKKFRKERGLTQEQLAEVFDMTIGAVHKWEAGLSTPDISLLMEMADFFDTSLDVLVGYNVRDNRIEVLCKRLRKMTDTMNPNGPAEADKALKKYPNNFKIVYECAYLYTAFSSMFKTTMEYAIRARELYEQSLRLISQNTDPKSWRIMTKASKSIRHITPDIYTTLRSDSCCYIKAIMRRPR